MVLEILRNRDIFQTFVQFLHNEHVFTLRLVSKELNFLITTKLNLFWAKVYYQYNYVKLGLESPIMVR